MTLPVKPWGFVRSDLEHIVRWYDSQEPGLAERFVEAVESAYDRIRNNPQMYVRICGHVRRALVPPFPYMVIYRVRTRLIEVLGILPCRSDPAQLARRLFQTSDRR